MKHKRDGGTIEEDWSKTYEHEGSIVPSYVCTKCGREILGDEEIVLEGYESYDNS